MNYLFLNHLCFENCKASISEIQSVLLDLARLMQGLTGIYYEIIFNSDFPQIVINNLQIKKIIYNLDNKEAKNVLLVKIDKNIAHPFASDQYDEYLNEGYTYNDYSIQGTDIKIFGTFLAAALYTKNPVLTPNFICSIKAFLGNIIIIECLTSIENYNLENILLSDGQDKNIERLRKIIVIEIKCWETWFQQLQQDAYIRITHDFKNDLQSIPFSSSSGRIIRRHIESLREWIRKWKIGGIASLDIDKCNIPIHDESQTVKNNPKLKRERKVKDCLGNENYAYLHTAIGNKVRMYFLVEEDFICICRVFTQHPRLKIH